MNVKRVLWILSLTVMVLATLVVFVPGSAFFSAGSQEKAASTVEVKIDNFSFGPATVTLAVGTTVTWINHDDIPHTVVSTESTFKSKVLDTDEKFSFAFTKPGTYPYFCSIHPKMTGKIIVQ